MTRVRFFSLATILGLLACNGHVTRAPMRPAEDALFSKEEVPAPEGLSPLEPEPFRLLPGDVVAMRTFSVIPLEVPRLIVDAAGFLHAPLAGTVQVANLSLEHAERLMQENLRRYDRFAIVALTLVEAAGHKATVLGAVAKPGTYTVGGVTRVADLLALAGGTRTMERAAEQDAELIDAADLEGARLLRAGVPLPISFTRAIAGDPRHNIVVAAGDVLYVPLLQGAAVRVLGQVKMARTIPWRPGLRLSEALARAGGMPWEADAADVRIIRGPLSRPRVYRASFAALVDGRATDVELARGDIIFVTEHWFASFTEVLRRLMPLLTAELVAASLLK